MRFANERRVRRLDQLTPALLDDFLASRSRTRPRSFNHLLGVVRCLLDWAVVHELLIESPLRARPRRATATRIPFIFDASQACRLLEAAATLPDNARAMLRGSTYRAIFGLCYGIGVARRGGMRTAAGRHRLTSDRCWWCGAASSARPASSRTGLASAP